MNIDDIIWCLDMYGNSVVPNDLVKREGKRKLEAKLTELTGDKVVIEQHAVPPSFDGPLNHQSKRKGPGIGYVAIGKKKPR